MQRLWRLLGSRWLLVGSSGSSGWSLARARAALVLVCCATACGGGKYSSSTQRFGGSERGESNGRMLDYVTMSPEGDQWEVRLRGTVMWVAYSLEDKLEKFAPVNLTPAESAKAWSLVEKLDLPSRRQGRLDERNGSVLLRLREPGEEEHDIYSVYFSRAAENEKVIALATHLSSLVRKYHKEKPPL